jgi:plastocyanin
MSRRFLLVLIALCSTIALVALAAPADATGQVNVTIMNLAFNPPVAHVAQGVPTQWTNKDGFDHTSASDQLFWESPHIPSNGTFSTTLESAGVYSYHCEIHTFMTGKVSVGLFARQTATGFNIRWSKLATNPVNRNFDVQIMRPGSSKWTSFRAATTKSLASFSSNVAGEYQFRARTRNLDNNQTSGWSPVLKIEIA